MANAAVGAAVQAGEGLAAGIQSVFNNNLEEIGNAFDRPTGAGSIISELVGDNIFEAATETTEATTISVGGNIFPPGAGGPPLESTNVFDG